VLVLAAWVAGQAGAAPRCYPNKRFEIIDTFTARDTLTNLVWRRQDNGLDVMWDAAQTSCPQGFRVPTVKELYSIVDTYATSTPTLDQTVFPGAAANYWTSMSVDPPGNYQAYAVTFGTGAVYIAPTSMTARVRCVR
jgi:hypothetical protein